MEEPAGHSEHAALPSLSANEPGAHGLHVAELLAPVAAENVPIGQRLQATEPFVASNAPWGHWRHEADPVALENEPAGQASQLDELWSRAAVPLGQAWQVAKPGSAKLPG